MNPHLTLLCSRGVDVQTVAFLGFADVSRLGAHEG
jgi:hypothetical protein